MENVMLDLETLDIKSSAVVVAIGAVIFDPYAEEQNWKDVVKLPNFYSVLELDEQIAAGRTVTGDTVRWWMKQGAQARRVFQDKMESVEPAMIAMENWVRKFTHRSNAKIWGNGSSFDCVILESLFHTYERKFVGEYWNFRDLRTLKEDAGSPRLEFETTAVAHNALDDARVQVMAAQTYRSIIGIRPEDA
ncbi:MAG: hypothetical protein DRI46_06755 [Chloroflexi bacterium]|nr:MAG: hypothetical protein DRI46_06755 [Chloroflexota bacterium]